MPDHGDIDHVPVEPRSWRDAMAALPPEAPDTGGWQRLQARLPAAEPAARQRWPLWLATAAALALAVAMPLKWQTESPVSAPESADPVTASAAPVETAAAPTPVAAPSVRGTAEASVAMTRPEPAAPAATSATRMPRAATRKPRATVLATTAEPAVPRADHPLDSLYDQSARLESLLAAVTDDHVANGPTAAISDAFDARLASIDAALIQPELDDAHRTALWRDRVDTLQQLVGIETTQRLYAARGISHDAALVTID